MKFTDISLIDLIVVLGLVSSLFISLYVGDSTLANSLVSGLLGYLGAKHLDRKVSTENKEEKGSDAGGTN